MITGTNIPDNTVIPSGSAKTISSLSIPPGIWIVSYYSNVYPDGGSVSTSNYQGLRYNLSTTIDTFDFIALSGSEGINYVNATVLPTIHGIIPLTISSTTTYYLNVSITYTGPGTIRSNNVNISKFKATRIG